MRRTALIACCTALLASGCGDGERPRTTARATPAAPASTPDPRLARCGLPPVRDDADPEAIPPDLRIPGSQVASSRRTGSALTATVLLPLSLARAYQTLLQSAPTRGYEVVFHEFEGFEAEVYVRNEAGLAKFRLRPSDKCADASQALYQRVTLDG